MPVIKAVPTGHAENTRSWVEDPDDTIDPTEVLAVRIAIDGNYIYGLKTQLTAEELQHTFLDRSTTWTYSLQRLPTPDPRSRSHIPT